MSTILIASCQQEISSFNPVPSRYSDFQVHRGAAFLEAERGGGSCISGALEVFEKQPEVRIVPCYGAFACSAGTLEQAGFERLAGEMLADLKENAPGADALYFALHGAMAAAQEPDPEGYLLEQARSILGAEIPIVISLDLHGILTERMIRHCNGLTLYKTYPHVDMVDTGQRAARLLLKILAEGLRPVITRVVVPALVRGDELITESGLYGQQIRYSEEIEDQEGVLAAGMMIGNPFTDVPELCSQAVVLTAGKQELGEELALRMAGDFWANRDKMQASLVDVNAAIREAKSLKGPLLFTDAADATSSGASGDSNEILKALLAQDYKGRVLLPLVDPEAVGQAIAAGVGGSIRAKLGGALDPRFSPIELDCKVNMLSTGKFAMESWGSEFDAGPTAVLISGKFTLVVTSLAVFLVDRSLFLAHGQDPATFDLIVVKSPHTQYRFFEAWAEKNFNIDVPGATSANLKSLGHQVCARPMFPLDEAVAFSPKAESHQT